ncbi:MAG: hypothetical protein KIS77_17290 [Saprospiraceae bacterium]|nr:hypothetical protein [Saprospiraceae bacterium]
MTKKTDSSRILGIIYMPFDLFMARRRKVRPIPKIRPCHQVARHRVYGKMAWLAQVIVSPGMFLPACSNPCTLSLFTLPHETPIISQQIFLEIPMALAVGHFVRGAG